MAKVISTIILAVVVLALPLSSSAEPVPFTQTPLYKYLCEIGEQKSPTYKKQLPKPQKHQPLKQSQKQPKKITHPLPADKPLKPTFQTAPKPIRRQDYRPITTLTPETTFAEAIDILRNFVKPPLNIVVFWKDLQENADIDRDTPIGIEGLSGITLRKHLELILASVSATADTELSYVVEDDIIKIATRDFLPKVMKTRVYDIADLTAPPARFFDYSGPYMFLQNRYGSGPGYTPGTDYRYGNYPSRYGNYPSRYSPSYRYTPNLSATR